ncbi:sigma-70 family RNA polymerase sigma factor [Fulvivirga sp. M361]|uniref:RNA polymerase sigma factor n=1 Tax=Fulvivirga sp. M361 TaxID=2594266 RepID=UPI00117BC708|nr:sigma-70 family RNA polymerase sigma factor [Fulvivirga sp. M361]TRX62047.1 sigma-70 family RNA polymerase sigma factor [Fulvivirga sp. M361]
MYHKISHNDDDLEKSKLKISKSSKPVFYDQDLALWDAFREGCESSFAMLYQKTFMDLYQYGLKISQQKELVKDCIHDLYVDLWNKREQLKAVDNVKGYLVIALKRRLINHFKRSKKISVQETLFEHAVLLTTASRESEIIDHQSLEERKARVFAAMEMLTSRQRKALHLKFYHNFSNQEIAKKLTIDINSTYNLISKAIKLLRNSLTTIILSLILFGQSYM